MKNVILLITLGLLLSSCVYKTALHSFTYHGTDQINNSTSFYYVAQGIVGKSQVEYSAARIKGGTEYQDGLIADAKANLFKNHPLGPNQAYANLAIDIIQTKKGFRKGGVPQTLNLVIQCIISADVIEYSSKDLSLLQRQEQDKTNSAQTSQMTSEQYYESLNIGDEVSFTKNGVEGILNGTIERIDYPEGDKVEVWFMDEKGKRKKLYINVNQLIIKQ